MLAIFKHQVSTASMQKEYYVLSSALQKYFSTKCYGKYYHDLGIFKGFVNFGYLLLTYKDALLLGGQGTKPYGDALDSLMHLF